MRRWATCMRATCITGDVKNVHTVRTGIEYMTWLAEWYTKNAKNCATAKARSASSRLAAASPATFPICVVPMLHQDLQRTDVPLLGLFLADQRFDHELWQLLRRRAERENHLGQARSDHAEIHHRERCDHRRAVDLCVGVGTVTDAVFTLLLRTTPKAPRNAQARGSRMRTMVTAPHFQPSTFD